MVGVALRLEVLQYRFVTNNGASGWVIPTVRMFVWVKDAIILAGFARYHHFGASLGVSHGMRHWRK